MNSANSSTKLDKPQTHSRPAVFLDRDGVIVVPEFREGRSYAPRSLESFKLFPDAQSSVQRLADAGLLVVVVTNQPDVGAGLVSLTTVQAMHTQLARDLPIHSIKVCLHTRAENCICRKPRPGMLIDAADELGIDLASSFMVGDRESDILAGKTVGCTTIFIDLGYTSEPMPAHPDYNVRNLTEAVEIILGHAKLCSS